MIYIPGFTIKEKIHIGRKSVLYRGIRNRDQLPVILKTLNVKYPEAVEIAKLKYECEIAQKADLAGVVRYYEIDYMDNMPFLVIEDFDGISLNNIIKRGQLGLELFLQIAIKLADTLARLHERNIIHKDINPNNIIFNPETGVVKISDFGISTVLTKDSHGIENDGILEGTLQYISPEQTGRVNRKVDYRTDFYALGVTFYEMLAGVPPFKSEDEMELVYFHLAKQPIHLGNLRKDIPQVIADMIMKLMEKDPEMRYRSAESVLCDLKKCLDQLEKNGRIYGFEIDKESVSNRFHIPQRLYGREQEIQLLTGTFDRTRRGSTEVMLVTGYSGIGKTSLVKELHKYVNENHGYFISGKFEEYKRNIPYFALIQAFSGLINQILTENETTIENWRKKILESLGRNSKIIIEVIPELEAIIGSQEDIPELPPLESQNRFNLAIMNFIRLFAGPNNPLVLFLDDLQWADSASLEFIKTIITGYEMNHILIIGSYRNNEVDNAHPLMLALNEIRQSGVTVLELVLKPLQMKHVSRLIADTLNCDLLKSEEFARLCIQKTEGNPFFLSQFLYLLHKEHFLEFDKERNEWCWDIKRISNIGAMDNVIDLMTRKIGKLSERAQDSLKLAACIGNTFALEMLVKVAEKEAEHIADALSEAVNEGLIVPMGEAYRHGSEPTCFSIEYRFLHDRIQQAAYSLIEDKIKVQIHLKIGRLMYQSMSGTEREEKVFDIVNQYNTGIRLITDREERDRLAELNLLAGRKAKESIAYKQAYSYFGLGIRLLGEDCWNRCYEMAVELYTEGAEAAYLNQCFEDMEELMDKTLKEAKTVLDKVRVFEVKIQACIAQNNLRQAIECALNALDLLGVKIPAKPTYAAVISELVKAWTLLAGKRIEGLANIPTMSDQNILQAMRIMGNINSTMFFTDSKLIMIAVFKQISLSIKYGNAPGSAYSYLSYGMFMSGYVKDINTGYRFGQLALKLLNKNNCREYESKITGVVHYYLNALREPFKNSLGAFVAAYESGLENGDFEFAAHNALFYLKYLFLLGEDLQKIKGEMALYSAAIKRLKQKLGLNYIEMHRQLILNFIDGGEDILKLKGEAYNEDEMLPIHIQEKDSTAIAIIYTFKYMLSCFFGEYQAVAEYIDELDKYQEYIRLNPIFSVESHFYNTLVRMALYNRTEPKLKKMYQKKIAASIRKMRKWASCCLENFLNSLYIMEAEYARINGNDIRAMEYYDKAINGALKQENIKEEALANELAARFFFEKGRTVVGNSYLREAYYCYKRWGADAKVKRLEQQYPVVLLEHTKGETAATAAITSSSGKEELDIASILKATQTISGEIVLEELLEKLVRIITQNAGAQKVCLIMKRDGELLIVAEGDAENDCIAVMQSIPVKYNENIPVSIINYVYRTKESIVLDDNNDALKNEIFIKEPYIRKYNPKSILCMPIINQGNLVGVLYLENNSMAGVFTKERIKTLRILSSQIAISIENANLYGNMEEMVRRRTKEIKNLLDNTGQGFLTFGQDLIIDTEYSAECKKIFSFDLSGMGFCELIRAYLPDKATDILEDVLASVFTTEDQYKSDVFLSLLPTEAYIGDKAIQIEYKRIKVISQIKIMVILTDITNKKQLERKMEEERNYLRMIVKAVVNRNDLRKCTEQYRIFCQKVANEIIDSPQTCGETLAELHRIVHTFKGEFAQWNMLSTADNLHKLEDEMENIVGKAELSKKYIRLLFNSASLESYMDKDMEILHTTLGNAFFSTSDEVLSVSKTDIMDLEDQVHSLLPAGEAKALLTKLRHMRYSNFKDIIRPYGDYMQELADRFGKSVESLVITGDDVLVNKDNYYAFSKSLIHLFRNIVDHGIETPEERVEMGKPEAGRVVCEISQNKDNGICIKIVDDGQGFDFVKIRDKAIEKGVYQKEEAASISEESLIELILNGGISTKTVVSGISGRGIGLSSVKREVDLLGGIVLVKTMQGRGTEFDITLPYIESF